MPNAVSAVYLELQFRYRELYLISIQLYGHKTVSLNKLNILVKTFYLVYLD